MKTYIQDWKSDGNTVGVNVDIEDLANYFDELKVEDEKVKASDRAVNTRIKQLVYFQIINSLLFFKVYSSSNCFGSFLIASFWMWNMSLYR